VTRSYVQRLLSNNSLLCTIYMHYQDVSTGRLYIVMQNALSHPGPYLGLYDLKACADDRTLEVHGRKIKTVRKRIWSLHLWCGDCAWSDDRQAYYRGKVAAHQLSIKLTKEQQQQVLSRLQLDTWWLACTDLMDYSLLVCMKSLSLEEAQADPLVIWSQQAPAGELRQPMVHIGHNQEVVLVYIRIIDFLQQWSCAKKIAMGLKCLEQNKATIPPAAYARRFLAHFSRNIEGGALPLSVLSSKGGSMPPCTDAVANLPSTGSASLPVTDDFHSLDGCDVPRESIANENACLLPKYGDRTTVKEASWMEWGASLLTRLVLCRCLVSLPRGMGLLDRKCRRDLPRHS